MQTHAPNRSPFRLLAIAGLISFLPAFGLSSASSQTSPQDEYEEREEAKKAADEIKGIVSAMWEALGDQNLEAFHLYCSDDWKLYTAGGKKLSAEQLFSLHRQNIRKFTLVPTGMDIHLAGTIAWITYDAVMSGELRGEPWGGQFIMTQIFRRNNDAWKCIHTHESKKPDPAIP